MREAWAPADQSPRASFGSCPRSPCANASPTSFLSAGLNYGITPDLQLDAGAALGLDVDEDFTLFTGITVRF